MILAILLQQMACFEASNKISDHIMIYRNGVPYRDHNCDTTGILIYRLISCKVLTLP